MNTNKEIADRLRALMNDSARPDDTFESGTDALQRAVSHFDQLAKDAEKDDALQATGECAASSLAEMVAALECDYDRLEELKEARDDSENPAQWAIINAGDAGELAEAEAAAGDCTNHEGAEQRIQEDPLSLEVRGGWYCPGGDGDRGEAEEFCILLGTGGPAVRIIGELNNGTPTRARLQTQDWFTPWTDYRGDAISSDDLLTYCSVFYLGE